MKHIKLYEEFVNEEKEINFNNAPYVVQDVVKDKAYIQINPQTEVKVGVNVIGIWNGMFGEIKSISGDKYKIAYDTGDFAQQNRRNLESNFLIKNNKK